jgi:hypothetical protein
LGDGSSMGIVLSPHPTVLQGTQQGSCYPRLKAQFKAQFKA